MGQESQTSRMLASGFYPSGDERDAYPSQRSKAYHRGALPLARSGGGRDGPWLNARWASSLLAFPLLASMAGVSFACSCAFKPSLLAWLSTACMRTPCRTAATSAPQCQVGLEPSGAPQMFCRIGQQGHMPRTLERHT